MAANGEMASRVPDGVQQICEGLARTLNVVIEDAPDMDAAKQYIRTRHNNIRCFPKCGKVHKTKSFCGTPLTITLQLSNGGSIEPFINQMYIFGEFRNVRKAPAFQVLSSCTPKQREQNAFVPGQLSSANGQASFTINPPRKWRYRARIAQILDMHVFTIYVVFQDVVVAIKDSPQFQVIPIWKADESMLKGDGEMEEEEEEDEVEASEDAEDGGENPDRLTRQESFSKRMKNNQQQQQQHFSGYQLHHDGSSSLHGSSPRQNASSATGSIVGLPFFSTQNIPSLRLGALPNQASSSDPNGSPKGPSVIASSSHATLNRTSSGSLFPPPMTQ